MHKPHGIGIAAGIACLFFCWHAELAASDSIELYETKVKPLLQQRCYACHGALKQEGGLRLDTAELVRAGGDSGASIVADHSGDSVLIQRVASEDVSERMPPEFEGEPLDAEEILLLRQWVESGAVGPEDETAEIPPEDHWAFQQIKRPPVPETSNAWVRNPIDAFLLSKMQAAGIEPQPAAEPLVIARRLKSDLIGLPLTPEEADNVGASVDVEEIRSTVERYLDDPRFGERWARHWMDIWRYSDWWGLGEQLRNSQKHIWHWRDWIIESLNEDLPYDEMIRQMLAADELYPNDPSKLRATGYLARNFFLFNRAQWMEETVEHVSKGFLGLTANCAKCHDHKYDPVSQTDYYRFRAFFEPYHVRMDIVPGETDIDRDGMPRAFDGVIDAKTFRYIRGDERNPDTSREILPGVFGFLGGDAPNITPISLPLEAWQPGRRKWVAEANIAAALMRVKTAEQALAGAESELDKARRVESEMRQMEESKGSADGEGVVNDVGSVLAAKFSTQETSNWKLIDGQWEGHPDGLKQTATGPKRAAVRLQVDMPKDFDVTFEFTILGGDMWKSVGISFDATQDATSATPSGDATEQHVYVSAYSGGSKVHASYFQNGQWVYPGGDPLRTMPIETNRRYKFRLQVRDSLINATLDDQLVIACELPLERRTGAMQFTAFDAIAIFHRIDLKPLDPKTELEIPKSGPAAGAIPRTLPSAIAAVAAAERAVEVAEVGYRVAIAEHESFVSRAAFFEAAGGVEPSIEGVEHEASATENEVESLHAAKTNAWITLRRLELLRAELRWIQAKHKLETTQGDKGGAEKELADAKAAVDKATADVDAPVDLSIEIPQFVGAKWTPTRFLNSGADDPNVSFPPTSTGRRAALASWIASPANPLTARVAVNHIWTRLMGQPLVPTVFDFGRKGVPPTHPELLDWLAAEFIDSGWSMKHIQRLILGSAAYSMSSSSEGNAIGMQQDPDNRLLWHRRPSRLESQVIRDSLLALSQRLEQQIGGPPVPANLQPESNRRSLYFFQSNNHRDLFLSTFDEALVTSCYRREESVVPQQALALANGALTAEVSRSVGLQLVELRSDPRERVILGFRWMLGDVPSEAEIAECLSAIEQWRSMGVSSEAELWSQIAWVFLNHNDFVTLR